MSKATDLATKCFVFADSAMGLRIFNEQELEVFYHAARAEALIEAADELDKQIHDVTDPVEWLRAMAYREGK